MNQLLDSFELRDLLIARGFSPLSSPERTKAQGFAHRLLTNPVYVKVLGGGRSGQVRPASEAPLVLHPADCRRIASAGLPAGVRMKAPDYTSAGLLEFKPADGKTPHGGDFWVESAAALDGLLFRLGLCVLDPLWAKAAAAELDAELGGRTIDATTRERLIEARLGQGRFRNDMLAIWGGRCAVTGCELTEALVASHSVAWRDDTSPATRLDPYNGLLLTASIDKLFDLGLIGFADDGRLLRQPGLQDADLAWLGLQPGARLRAQGLHDRHRPYLAAHRAKWRL